jgi:dUTP pyrophosphatase
MKIMLSEGAFMPMRSHPWDAGLDLFAKEDGVIRPCDNLVFDTGVHLQIPEGFTGFIRSRSGLMVNHHIVTDGTIDSHYTGSIRVKLFNLNRREYRVHAGDKIAQIVIVPCALPELELVDHLEETDRGDGGFGSTGR